MGTRNVREPDLRASRRTEVSVLDEILDGSAPIWPSGRSPCRWIS